MKILFVVNPISGGIDKEPFLQNARTLCHKYGIVCSVFKTTGKDDKKHLEHNVKSFKPDKIISCGGDGTTLFTATTLLNSGYPMGIIPLGSANGMAKELFVNINPLEALKDIILSEVIAGLDLIRINDEYYSLHIGDVGINAQIVDLYEKDSKRGMTTYAKYFLQQLKNFRSFNVTINCSAGEFKFKTLMLGICNARKYGTGIPLNTIGNPMDGKIELVLVNTLNQNILLKAGLAKFDETFFDHENNQVISTEFAEVAFEKPRLLQLDGEVIGKFKTLKIEVLKGAINFITHKDNAYLRA